MATVYDTSSVPANHVLELHSHPARPEPIGHPTFGIVDTASLLLSGPLAPLYLYSTLRGKSSVWQKHLDRLPDAPFYQPVLDVGCGRGLVLLMLSERKRCLDTYEKAYGIDIFGGDQTRITLDAIYANVASAALIDQTVVNEASFTEQLPFKDDAFGVVTSSLTLHKVDRESRTGAVQEMMRVCAPEGYVVIIDLSPYVGGYAKTVKEAGWTEVETSWAGIKATFGTVPSSILRARKPK